ncbi:hypothetical protein [Sorangium sp. So ce128]|uniref:hypothetical protein n=1 Tax=Sorangium sp. So ce128 TaxID=3133281 RepID=UPI003F5F6DBC
MSITFAVSDVDRPQQLMQVLDRAKAIPSLLGGGERTAPEQRRMLRGKPRPPVARIEAFSPSDAPLVFAAEKRADWRFEPEGPDLLQIPSSISSAPVRFVDVRDGTAHPLRFVAGLFGVTQEAATGALAPEFGWAIVHDDG